MTVTIAYLVGIAVVIAYYACSGRYSISPLSLNMLGDFLAGVFAPLAFLWVVLGYLQQGEELRNSVRALEVQGQELERSVKVSLDQFQLQQKVFEEQREEIRRSSSPVFVLTFSQSPFCSSDGRIERYNFAVKNYGNTCSDVKAFVLETDKILGYGEVLRVGEAFTAAVDLPFGESPQFNLGISYLDSRQFRGTAKFKVHKEGGEIKVTPLEAV